MTIIKYTPKERDLLARIMRAEAIGEGNLGMLMVGDVVINRVLANCLTFKNIDTITKALAQKGGFSGTKSQLYYSNPTKQEQYLANRVLRGEYYYPATNALWFYAPRKNQNCRETWYDQQKAGRYKNHCFYKPQIGQCKEIR